MSKALRLLLAWAALSAIAGAAAVAAAAPPAGADERRITMNFKDAELEAVVQFMSEVAGKNFILDEKVRGKVTVISPTKVTPAEAYEVFQAILGVKGFTIVPAGKVLKIVATREAKQTNIETVQQDSAPPGDRFVTRLLPLKHVEAEAMAGILAPLVSKDSSIVAYAPTNTLILTDAYSNIERLVEILSALDVETVETTFQIIQLRYAAADAVAKSLSQAIVERGRSSRRRTAPRAQPNVQVQAEGTAVKIIPDSRTNSLIIIADPTSLEDLKTMIKALDVEIPKGSGKINVYYLKYADADNVASVLTAISKSAGTKPKPGQPPTPPGGASAVTGEVSVQFEEPVQITADKTTNSLVIIASPQDYEILRSVIEKLDIRRPQVLVETVIIEMSYEKSLELGVEWRSVNDPTADSTTAFGGTNFGQLANLAVGGPLAVPSGLFLGAVKGTLKFAGREFLNVGALVRALQGTGDVNVLSTPHVLTTDNEEAEIVVSDNIPFKTSEKFDSNGNPISTFEYRDVGLTLRLTPQINEDEFVKLKMFQEVSDIVDTATGGSTNAPRTTKRSAKTTVVVRDNSTVVIGGLIKDSTKNIQSAVPCLGDLPLLGYLFRSSKDETRKTNLLIFLTPRIIRNMGQIEDISKGLREEFQEENRGAEGPPATFEQKVNRAVDRGRPSGEKAR